MLESRLSGDFCLALIRLSSRVPSLGRYLILRARDDEFYTSARVIVRTYIRVHRSERRGSFLFFPSPFDRHPRARARHLASSCSLADYLGFCIKRPALARSLPFFSRILPLLALRLFLNEILKSAASFARANPSEMLYMWCTVNYERGAEWLGNWDFVLGWQFCDETRCVFVLLCCWGKVGWVISEILGKEKKTHTHTQTHISNENYR